jgi:L-lactate dehydrogenase
MENWIQPFKRVAIVGAGRVGSTCAYALLLQRLASEIVLISNKHEQAEGEAMDLNHGMLFVKPARIWAGDYSDCAEADIVVLAAGVAQSPGETRMDLLRRNAALFQEIVPQVMQYARDPILIVVTNPVDVLTYVTWEISGLPASQVLGSGTVLDTARVRYLLSQHYHVEPRSVHAFVIGEHGDSQVMVWSLANIAGIRLDDYGNRNGRVLSEDLKAKIEGSTRTAAYEVIRRKGATYYAIAAGVVRIVEAVSHNENSVLTVSSLVQGTYGFDGVCLSLPSVVNTQGIARMLELPLAEEERVALQRSAQTIRSAIESLRVRQI